MIFGILLYGVAFLLLALAQVLKKDIFQKTVAPAFCSISRSTFFVVFVFVVDNFLTKTDLLFLRTF